MRAHIELDTDPGRTCATTAFHREAIASFYEVARGFLNLRIEELDENTVRHPRGVICNKLLNFVLHLVELSNRLSNICTRTHAPYLSPNAKESLLRCNEEKKHSEILFSIFTVAYLTTRNAADKRHVLGIIPR